MRRRGRARRLSALPCTTRAWRFEAARARLFNLLAGRRLDPGTSAARAWAWRSASASSHDGRRDWRQPAGFDLLVHRAPALAKRPATAHVELEELRAGGGRPSVNRRSCPSNEGSACGSKPRRMRRKRADRRGACGRRSLPRDRARSPDARHRRDRAGTANSRLAALLAGHPASRLAGRRRWRARGDAGFAGYLVKPRVGLLRKLLSAVLGSTR